MDNKEKNTLNAEKLIDAIGAVEERFIEEATPVRRRTVNVFQIASAAAIFIVMIIGGVVLFTTNKGKEEGMDEKVTRAPIRAPLPEGEGMDSDVVDVILEFETLDELLEYLGENEEHPKVDGPTDYSSNVGEISGVITWDDVSIYEGYEYIVKEGKVNIVDLVNKDAGAVLVMGIDATKCIVANGKLIVLTCVSLEETPSTEVTLDGKKAAYEIRIYDLSNPIEPELEYEYVQNGSYVTSYVVENKLYLFTGDGECSCGYNGENKEKYKPGLTVNGEKIEWTDEDIYILGTPTLLQYVSMTEIDIVNNKMTNKKSFYGDIKKTHIGTDWIAIETYNSAERKSRIYTFDTSNNMEYGGVIDEDRLKKLLE